MFWKDPRVLFFSVHRHEYGSFYLAGDGGYYNMVGEGPGEGFNINVPVWPVIVTPYNLPPGMCMKREYFFLSILVPGPKYPKKSLDIYLQPLIEELKNLWRDGVDAYDVSRKQTFTM